MKKKLAQLRKIYLTCQHLKVSNKFFEYYPNYHFEFDSKIDKNILFITCASKIKKNGT